MKIMVIDGNSILNRAFYGVRLLSNHEGLFTNAIYGFLATYFKLKEEEKPDRTIVCFDVKEKTFRHKAFEMYKAQRKGMPDELAMQLPVMKEILDAMGVMRYELCGFEADDLLGTISRLSNEHGNECVIVTGDKDSLQLIGEGTLVKLVSTRMGQTTTKNYDTEAFIEQYGFEPIKMIDLKGLMGDPSDNIPGVPGIGEKTAMTLVQTFGSIDTVYDNVNDDSIKKGVRAKLIEGKEMADISRRLATIERFVPIELNIENLPAELIDEPALYQLFTKLEFKNFITKLGLTEEKAEVASVSAVTRVTVKDEDEIFTAIKNEKSIVLSAPKNLQAICLLVQDKAYLLKASDFGNVRWKSLLTKLFFGEFPLIVHDGKAYLVSLMEDGIEPDGILFDTCIGAYLLNPAESGYSLEKVALAYLSKEILPMSYESEEAFSLLGGSESSIDALVQHAEIISALYHAIAPKIEEEGMKNLCYEIEIPLIYVLASMQVIGFKADAQQLRAFGEKLSVRIDALTAEIYELAGEMFNINSPKKLGEILFDKLQLPTVKKTKTGYSTNIEVLEALQGYNPIIGKIIEYRQLTKLKSTYVDGLLKVISPKDGRIHSSFNQTVTVTGRLSSTEPNLQNIPVRHELGSELRRMFVASDGKVLVDADYSQIELRVLAHIAKDKTMIEAFKTDKDIHTITASQVFHVPENEVTSLMRRSAKAVNFGIVYGISGFSLANDIGVSVQQAGEYINSYLNTYKGVHQYMDEIKSIAKEQGYVSTLFNRRRYLPELKSKNFNIRSFGERVALNTPIQGTAADIIKVAMVRVYKRLKKENMKTRLILQVHDELILEAPEDEKERAGNLLKEEMEHALELSAALKTDVAYGIDWYSAKGA